MSVLSRISQPAVKFIKDFWGASLPFRDEITIGPNNDILTATTIIRRTTMIGSRNFIFIAPMAKQNWRQRYFLALHLRSGRSRAVQKLSVDPADGFKIRITPDVDP